MAKARTVPKVVEKRFRAKAPPADADDRYLRLGELARYSSLSRTTLQRFIADPVHPLPVHRVLDRITLVLKSEFDQWVREREALTAAKAPRASSTVPVEVRRAAMAVRGWPVEP